MRCFSEDKKKGEKQKETLVIMSLSEAKILYEALEYKINSLPKSKTRKERILLEELSEKWCIY